MSQKPLTYADAGVSIDAGNALVKAIGPLARSTARPGADAELGGFGGFFDLKAAGYRDPLLVAANDGVGTKLKLAIETGRHDGVGIDLVAMCANDLIVQGAEPLFFLDYYATGKLDNDVAAAVVASIAEGCRQAGCALIGGETAEMPGMYAAGDYDLAGFCVGAVERDKVLTGDEHRARRRHPRPRQLGRALQRLLAGPPDHRRATAGSSTEPLPSSRRPHARRGAARADADLRPLLLPLVREGRIKGLAHITGGGLLENIPRVLPDNCHAIVDADAWPLPAAVRASPGGRRDRAGGDGADLQLRHRHGRDRRRRTRPMRSPQRSKQPARPCFASAASRPARAAARCTAGRQLERARGLVRDPPCLTEAASRS